MLKFALIGDGAIAKYHKEAIKHVGGELLYIVDPKYTPEYKKTRPTIDTWAEILPDLHFPNYVDYAIICSPSCLHYSQIKEILETGHILRGIICEKPAFLPWEPAIIDDKVNIVLQLRYLPNLPEKADLVSVRFVRDEAYFKSWKGDARKTGGLFYNLFLHGIDLAMRLGADFEGVVAEHGEQERWIGAKHLEPQHNFLGEKPDSQKVRLAEQKKESYISPLGVHRFVGNGYLLEQFCKKQDLYEAIDILNIDTQACYNRLYEAILEDKGIKPSDLFYLSWILQRNSEIFGYGRNGIGKTITIKNELM